MKSLYEYVAETSKDYTYRIKVAGELTTEALTKFKEFLGKYELENCSTPKQTPISEQVIGFPGLKNEALNIFEVTINYPAGVDAIREEARLAGINPARIIVISEDWDDSMQAEAERVEDTTLLEKEEYPENTKDQVELSEKYSGSFKDIVKNAANTKFEIAGGKPAKAKFNTDKDGNEESPMSKETRPSTEEILK